jgi:hypothetical protein
MKERHIYPSINMYVELDLRGQKTVFKTSLRKKHKGKWYFWNVTLNYYHKDDLMIDEMVRILNNFHSQVYQAILLGKLNPKIRYEIDGILQDIFELDPDQRSETERLMNIINPKTEHEKTQEHCAEIYKENLRLARKAKTGRFYPINIKESKGTASFKEHLEKYSIDELKYKP